MRLVSEQSDEDIRKAQALEALKPALRQLAANLMRISRGAGRSALLGNQMVECIDAMVAYRDAAGHGVASWDLDRMLDPDMAWEEYRPWIAKDEEAQQRREADGTLDEEYAEQEIRRACLQITASMLVNQRTQMARGEDDFWKACESRQELRERRLARHEVKVRAGRADLKKGRQAIVARLRKGPVIDL